MDKIYEATCETVVSEELTAIRMESGSLPVYASPALSALAEKAACAAAKGLLEEGQTSVGTFLSLYHTSATPVGMKVTCRAVLTERDGRKLRFEITAYDEKGEIGKATHERVIVTVDRFLEKAYSKLN